MTAPAPAPHAEGVPPGGGAPGRTLRRDRARGRAVLRRRRAAALALVAAVGVAGLALARGTSFGGQGSTGEPDLAVAVPPPAVSVAVAVPDGTGPAPAAGTAADEGLARVLTRPGEPCRPEPGGALLATGALGGAAFGASALGCAMPAWQALPPTSLEATEPEMVLAQVTREQAVDPVDYRPDDLVPLRGGFYEARAEVAEQLDAMLAAAAGAGYPYLTVTSGFRSYETQAGTFADWAGRMGQERAELVSARPGHSEHQLGLAVDLAGSCSYQCFGTTPEGRWVAENAHRWGFIIRYPEDGHAVTGYAWEPWHVRYVGPRAAWGMRLADEPYWENFQPVAAVAAGLD